MNSAKTNPRATVSKVSSEKPNRQSSPVLRVALILAACLWPATALAQTTAFTYQGRFTEEGSAANGTYEMQFRLFDVVSAGNQIGSTITNSAISVSNGVFTVQLDFGAGTFSGADRYLEIGVRRAGDSSAYTLLSPRQQLTSAVYAIRAGSAAVADTATTATSADTATTATNATNATNATTATNATQLGGVAASQYVQTSDSRLADARTPTAGSSNYIQNSSSQQTASFNISGNGTAGGNLSANAINTTTNYSIGGSPVLSVSGGGGSLDNTFTGIGAGIANQVLGGGLGIGNSFYGGRSGTKNTTGHSNSFFGTFSGVNNTTGGNNSFFGEAAGLNNGDGFNNAFFGGRAGETNKTGSSNVYIGAHAGSGNSTGSENVLVGNLAGYTNQNGSSLTAVGYRATGTPNLTNATAIGAKAYVSKSNSLVLGSIQNLPNVNPAEEDTNVGIGTPAPNARFHIVDNGGNIIMGNGGCGAGYGGIGFVSSLTCKNYSLVGDGLNTHVNRPTGGTLFFNENGINQMSIAPGGVVTINNLTPLSGGITHLCSTASNQISNCSSSLRYKKDLQPFKRGLSLLNQLKPITFKWKSNNADDLGFGAEDIAAIEPLLVTRNAKGEVEGVKYDRITAVLVNAVKEQQEQIKQQQSQIESLKNLVCRRNRRAPVCK